MCRGAVIDDIMASSSDLKTEDLNVTRSSNMIRLPAEIHMAPLSSSSSSAAAAAAAASYR